MTEGYKYISSYNSEQTNKTLKEILFAISEDFIDILSMYKNLQHKQKNKGKRRRLLRRRRRRRGGGGGEGSRRGGGEERRGEERRGEGGKWKRGKRRKRKYRKNHTII